MIVVLLLSVVAFANAGPLDTCRVGAWSEWSPCVSSSMCSMIPVHSYSVPPTPEWDEGRDTMQKIQIAKTENWKAMDECREKGTCPEMMKLPLNGAYPCNAQGIAGDIPCLNIDQESFLTFTQMGYVPISGDNSPRGNDVWGWTDPVNGDEYAIMGLTGATTFVRVTNPKQPVPVGVLNSQTGPSSWRDIKVIGNWAYIVSEARDHGLQVFDLTRLRGRDTIGRFTADAVNTDFGNAHNIVANEATGYVYVVGATQTTYPRVCRGGLLVIDVRNPRQPTYAGCFGGDGYVHDAQCVNYRGPDSRYTGREICFCFNENSLTIVDASNKASMSVIAKTAYTNVAYTHQGWVTEDHRVILLDDEQDEYRLASNSQFTKTYVWDIDSLTAPTLRSVFQASVRSIDHNQYIIGDLTYQANYESGLRILRLNRSTFTLSLVAYFDVFPSRTTSEFNGAWSTYPYFKSGNVLISSIDYGLFVVRPRVAEINKLIESQTTYGEQNRTRSVLSDGAVCPALVETRACDAPELC